MDGAVVRVPFKAKEAKLARRPFRHLEVLHRDLGDPCRGLVIVHQQEPSLTVMFLHRARPDDSR